MSLNMFDYFCFEIKKADIKNGVQDSETENPLSLAFTREFNAGEGNNTAKKLESVEVSEAQLGFYDKGIVDDDDGDENTTYSFTFMIGRKIILYLMAFDTNRDAVEPILVHCNIIDEERDEHNNNVEVFGTIHLDSHHKISEVVDPELMYELFIDNDRNYYIIRD